MSASIYRPVQLWTGHSDSAFGRHRGDSGNLGSVRFRGRPFLLVGTVEVQDAADVDLSNAVFDQQGLLFRAVVLFVFSITKSTLDLDVGTLLELTNEVSKCRAALYSRIFA